MPASNARIGFVLFCVYLPLYGGFVFLNAYAPEAMEATPIKGVNLAILYGFGLIVAAFVLALVYGYLCNPADAAAADSSNRKGGRRDARTITEGEGRRDARTTTERDGGREAGQ
jgi:uncharacterized membrane protein (DUF485 family)